MQYKIREYLPTDRAQLIKLTEELQDYLIAIDPLKRLIRSSDYGAWYLEKCVQDANVNHGKVLVAESQGEIISFIVGIIDQESSEVGRGYIPTKAGRVTELYVCKAYRSQGMGLEMMRSIEEFFVAAGCDLTRIEVFAPNEAAKRFYESLGYQTRSIEMVKVSNTNKVLRLN